MCEENSCVDWQARWKAVGYLTIIILFIKTKQNFFFMFLPVFLLRKDEIFFEKLGVITIKIIIHIYMLIVI